MSVQNLVRTKTKPNIKEIIQTKFYPEMLNFLLFCAMEYFVVGCAYGKVRHPYQATPLNCLVSPKI
jgi:hypothetical protein